MTKLRSQTDDPDELVDYIMKSVGGDMKDVVKQGGGWSARQDQTDNGYIVVIRVQTKPQEDDTMSGGKLTP